MLETITREFRNEDTDYIVQHRAEKNFINLSNWINSYIQGYGVALDKINAPIIRKRFREEIADTVHDIYLTSYDVNTCSIMVCESSYSRWIPAQNTYRCFERGKIEINIISNQPSMLDSMAMRLNALIYQYENPVACPTCWRDNCE